MWRASGRPPPAAWRAVISESNLTRARGSRFQLPAPLVRRGTLLGGEHALGGELGDGRGKIGGIAAVDDVLHARERLVYPLRIKRWPLGCHDLLSTGRPRPLVGVEQVLVDLLAWPGADDFYRNVDVRLLPRQPDHVARQVHDLHRLPHVEHEDLAAAGEAAGADDQLH